MKFPRKVNRYCPHCHKHTEQIVSVYKKGKERMLNEARRRVERGKAFRVKKFELQAS
ncbi:MAG: hypothetical protein P8Y70_09215 [Candidatus Lokiarchaeota archaeon]